MPEPSPRPLSARRTAAFAAVAAGCLLALVARPEGSAAQSAGWRLAPADTDSVAAPAPAALPVAGFVDDATPDTIAVDTLAADSTARARAYFPVPVEDSPSASPILRWRPEILGRRGALFRRQVALDSTAFEYRVTESVGSAERVPAVLTLDEFLAAKREETIDSQFRTLAAQRTERQQARRGSGGLGFAVDIPGGEQSAFRTLFGKNEVALTVNGTSNVNLGIRYDQNDLQEALRPNASPYAPDFGQDLNLNVAGTIGDKLAINVNYDTQSQFDFENQVSLVYTGYEDDILQRFEAGNVFLQTPSTLIRGGQRLFGLRTDLQFGPLAVTAVASQQDAETVDRVFEGGADAQTFRLAPYDYEDDTHFFLGYRFHNWWDEAHRRPQNPQLPPNFRRFVGIEVWKHEPGLINATQDDAETTWAVALADLAEPPEVLAGGEAYLGTFDAGSGVYSGAFAAPLPDPVLDQYDDAVIEDLRTAGATATAQSVGALLPQPLPATGAFANNVFKRLRANVDYTFDGNLGWISLATSVTDNDLIAVAYQYETLDGDLVNVGDYGRPAQSTSQTGPRTILKLIRADRPTPSDPLWDLTLRNVYRIGGRSLNPSTFELGITYEPAGASASTVPLNLSFEQRTFLEVLGLDRVNEQGLATPDEVFDFRAGETVDPENGRVIFPVRQPFGDYLVNLITTGQTVGTIGDAGGRLNVTLGGVPLDETLEAYVPTLDGATLYDIEPENARRRLPRLADYLISGEYKSATQSVFNIGFQLVEGTVRVTSGDLELREGTDYRVNYTAGTVEITNPTYLQQGQRVQVSVEQNQFFNIGSKTLVGLRGDYRFSDDLTLGATWMRLSERPLGDKFRVGEEALNNSIVGLDGSYQTEPRWLTRAVDALPLINTRAPSRIEIRGEVARLSPGHPQTLAFDRTRDALRDAGLDFDEDELSGVSYIDDFEGSENAYTALRFTDGWRLAGPPDAAGPSDARDGSALEADVTDPTLRTNWRGLFTWYSIPPENGYNSEGFREVVSPATEPVPANELFPNRQFVTQREAERGLDLLDLYFDPTRRGPYNYNATATGGRYAQNPREAWGGFARPIEGSYSNFDGQNNIEFVEILFTPLGGVNGTEPVADGAVMYLDLGRVNEDILPNGFLNSEDGLVTGDATQLDAWGRRPTGRTNGFVDFIEETQRTEDLGLDGLPSLNGLPGAVPPYEVSEADVFAPFLSALAPGSAEAARAAEDPSGDDFYNFDDPRFNDRARYPTTPNGATIQERYGNYYPARELNSALAQQSLRGGRGISVIPNTEDLNGNNSLDRAESFHRYTIPLDAAGLASSPFFQNTLPTEDLRGQPQTWYLMRIPVRTDRRESIGIDPDDFSRIEAVRLWTTGHDKPVTMRIASFELVGSQWLKSDQVGGPDDQEADRDVRSVPPQLFIESVNNEENSSIYAIPRGTIQNTARSISGVVRSTREQALVFRAEGLADGRRAGISRSYATGPLDLTKYSNLRAAVHGHGFERSDSMRVFVRIGDDETENYYEYEQPVYPFDPDDLSNESVFSTACRADQPFNCAQSDSLWQTNVQVGGERVDLNPMNVVLADFNRAKLQRDRAGEPLDERYTIAAREGAPDGARITVRGQPSIQDVRTVVMGIRNGRGGRGVVDTVSVWFNELRVTGYDEDGGASGFVTANVALADVALLNARASFTDDGFGDLGGTLGGRAFASSTAYTLTSSFNAHKLLPERFGWSIPVSYTLTQNESTPRFDPDNGDVRLDDLVEAARAGDPDVVDDETGALAPDLRAEAILDRARTEATSQNFRVSASKSGSRSPWLRYTIDGLTASYSAATQTGSNPSAEFSDTDNWTAAVNYRVTVPRPLAVRPFWLLDRVPVLGSVVGGLRFNLLPQSITASTDARRNFAASRQRLGAQFLDEPDSVRSFRALTRRTHRFEHGRQFSIQHTPLPFLQLSFASNTDQDLGAAGQRERFRILVRDVDGTFSREYALSPNEARADTSVVYADLVEALDGFEDGDPFPSTRVEILGGSDLQFLPLGEALTNAFDGDLRTRQYAQQASATLRVSTRRQKWLSWLQIQPIAVSANYDWRDQPSASAPDLDVASAGTQANLQTAVQVQPRTFWRLFPFYRSWEAEADAVANAATDSTSGGSALNPARLGRRLFLAATGIDDISVTYRGTATSATAGLEGQAYSLWSAFSGDAPSLAYRLGIDREIGLDQRVQNTSAFNTFSDLLAAGHDVDARTQLSPFRGLSIGLSWRAGWSSAEEVDFRILGPGEGGPGDPDDGSGDPDDSFRLSTPGGIQRSVGRRTGEGESTVFAFGGSYEAIVEAHAARFQRDSARPPSESGAIASEFLSPTGYARDFASTLARGLGGFGPNGLFQIPVPGWTVSYSGLERLPLLRAVANQISLQHGYSASARTEFATLFDVDSRVSEFEGLTFASAAALADDGFDEPTSVTVNERFQPLIGVTFGFKGNIQTSFSTNRTSQLTLQAPSATVYQKTSQDLRFDFSYARTGLSLFGLRGLNNNIRFQLTALVAGDETLTNLPLQDDVINLLNGDPFVEVTPQQTSRLQVSPQISYTISNQVTANLLAQYERTNSEIAGESNRFTGGVSLRILFSN